MKHITRTVWVLSFVSFFTDIAGEMLYPVMPVYLKSIGFSIVLIGVLEGCAEATAGLSKGYFGKLSDETGKRVLFVRLGYFLSGVSRPLMIVFTAPLWVFMARTFDRFGKGIRTGARDAILSAEATAATRGRVFGFHRSMDTLGAVFGPALALCYLYFYPGQYRSLFLLAIVPGALAVAGSFMVNDKLVAPGLPVRGSFFSFLKYWKKSSGAYRRLVAGLLAFALFNSSDVFLLLKVKEGGFSDSAVIGVYIFYNLVYAVFAYPLGVLADRIGLKRIFITGLLVFAFVYMGVGFATTPLEFYALFLLYGIYAAATEGISKAWISNISAREDTATAIGMYTGFQSICALLASSLTGLIWYAFGAMTTFVVTSVATALVAVYFIFSVSEKEPA
jgi:MFS family permease